MANSELSLKEQFADFLHNFRGSGTPYTALSELGRTRVLARADKVLAKLHELGLMPENAAPGPGPCANDTLRERLAAVQHAIWAHWMKYQLSVCRDHSVGTAESVVIPPDKLERWKRQMDTAYADLSEQERGSDREQADKVLAVLQDVSIYHEIQEERRRQDVQWGGPSHDDTHHSGDWIRFIVDHAIRALWLDYRQQLIKAAALAVAAIAAWDRTGDGSAPAKCRKHTMPAPVCHCGELVEDHTEGSNHTAVLLDEPLSVYNELQALLEQAGKIADSEEGVRGAYSHLWQGVRRLMGKGQ